MAPLLRDTLRAQGLHVFYDEGDIQDLDAIERRITDGLAAAALFICWYSDIYRTRRACIWELTAALTTDAQRVVVINPEPGVDHILPASLRATLIPSAPDRDDGQAWERLGKRIADDARAKAGAFGAIAKRELVGWYGDPPQRFARFVGRAEQIWALDSLLRPAPQAAGGSDPPEAVVVHGLGGVGKTALASEYASRFAGAYRGGIFWLRAGIMGEDVVPDTGTQLTQQLVTIANQLNPVNDVAAAEGGIHSHDEAALAIRLHLDHAAQPCLWVVDALPAGLSSESFGAWLPGTRNGCVLVTTRGTTYRHVPNLELPLMPPDESVELLLSAHGNSSDVDSTAAASLAKRLGNLPLALEVVGALSAIPGASPEALLAELVEPIELTEEAAANPMVSASPTEHPLSPMTTFGPSISRLDADSFALLATAAAVNVGPLPTRLIELIASRVSGMAAGATRNALGTLLSRSLAKGVDAESFEVHTLIAGAALQFVDDRSAFTDACADDAGRSLAHLLGDIEDIRTHAANRRLSDFGLGLLASHKSLHDWEAELWVRRRLGRFLHVEHRYDEASVTLRRALAIAATKEGDQARETLNVKSDLAISLANAGATREATPMLEDCAAALEKSFGADDIDLLTVKHNLANQLFASDPVSARRLAIEVYERRLRVLGPTDPHTLFSIHSLLAGGIVPPGYPDLRSAYEDLIARRTALLGPDQTTTLTTVQNYVEFLLTYGEPQKALSMARDLVTRNAGLYGPTHPLTYASRARLLRVLLALPEPPFDEVQTIIREIDGSAIPTAGVSSGTITAISNLGEELRRSGQAELAVRVLRAAQQLATESLAPSNRLRLLVQHNLGAALAAAGSLDLARAQFDALVGAMDEHLGADDGLTLRARRQQALLMARQGQGDLALELQQALAETLRSRSGASSREFSQALGDIAETLEQLGRSTEANQYRELQEATGNLVDPSQGVYL